MANVVSVSTPADAVNAALGRIGYKLRVGNLYDGSEQSKAALDIYGQTRDDVMTGPPEWDFAQRDVPLTLLKSAPAGGYVNTGGWTDQYPPLPWLYEYTYPDNCLKVRCVKGTPLFVPNFNPVPQSFSIINDEAYVPARKVIVCNVYNANAVITGRITNPLTWNVPFAEALIAALARRLAPALTGLDVEKLEAGDEQMTKAKATVTKG